jgi:glycosyltransferase involved in cell wall biosynthesis
MAISILHIWDTAGVASILSKYLRKCYNVKSDVVNINTLDPFNITAFYYGRCYPKRTLTTIKFLVKGLNYKIIHVHSAYRFVKYFRRIYPFKRIVMHFHGEDVRCTGWDNLKQIIRQSNLILVSTPDLLEGAPDNVVYLPNPVDIDHFKPNLNLRREKTALYFLKHQRKEDLKWTKEIVKQYNLKLYIHDRKRKPIPYSQLPPFLNSFEFYIDPSYPHAVSKTALEAMACGLKVVLWNGEIIDKLPEEHNPFRVAKKTMVIISRNAMK